MAFFATNERFGENVFELPEINISVSLISAYFTMIFKI